MIANFLSNKLQRACQNDLRGSMRLALQLVICVCLVFLPTMLQAATVDVQNKLANGYASDPFTEDCPSGYTVSNIPSGFHIERPHAIHNAATNEWVLWAHYDNANYTTAEALVATSSTECGPYTIYSEFQPMGEQVRDDYLFEDTNGTAYFIAASNKDGGANDTMGIWRLTSNYLSVDSTVGTTWVFEGGYREAPIVFKSGSVYYLLSSQAAGWFPSQGGYATSTSMISGWSALADLGNPSTFGGQESNIKIFSGTAGTAYILVLDHLGGNTAHDDGDMWLPLTVNSSAKTATLEWYTSYSVNTTTGAVTLPTKTDLTTSTTTASSVGATGCHSYFATDQNYQTDWCASGNVWPSWWQVDLGSSKTVKEIDTSWWMDKGSEAYYQYDIEYSTDGVNYTTLSRTNNELYGFTNDQVNFTARYIRLNLVNAVIQNNPSNWYTPTIWEVKVFSNN